MTVKELLTAAGLAPSGTYTGEVRTNCMILGVNTGSIAKPCDYAVAAVHMEDLGAAIDAETEDESFLYEGKMTLRAEARRTFSLSGRRYVGDAFQDWACGHSVKFGTGSGVQTDYIYFSGLTGKGEKGTLTMNVTSDGGGEANTPAAFEAEASSVGIPDEWTYTEN